MAALDPANYQQVQITLYETLDDKLQALMNGEVLLLKSFEQGTNNDVLVRFDSKKYTLCQISQDLLANDQDPRFWVTYNIGVNDLSLFTAMKFDESLVGLKNEFTVNDIILYTSGDGTFDSGVITGIYTSIDDPSQFAYTLSRDEGLYAESDLILQSSR